MARSRRSRQLALLQAGLDAMTEAQRAAFVAFELEELSARQVAEQLGVSEGTVVSRVRRAREVFWRIQGRCEERAALTETSDGDKAGDGAES